jgi:hypothetical protein
MSITQFQAREWQTFLLSKTNNPNPARQNASYAALKATTTPRLAFFPGSINHGIDSKTK